MSRAQVDLWVIAAPGCSIFRQRHIYVGDIEIGDCKATLYSAVLNEVHVPINSDLVVPSRSTAFFTNHGLLKTITGWPIGGSICYFLQRKVTAARIKATATTTVAPTGVAANDWRRAVSVPWNVPMP